MYEPTPAAALAAGWIAAEDTRVITHRLDWMVYDDVRIAEKAAAILARMTGDVCAIRYFRTRRPSRHRFRVMRRDVVGREV
jgi:hypothetical protein